MRSQSKGTRKWTLVWVPRKLYPKDRSRAREQGSGEILIRGVGLRGGNIKQPISKGKGRNTRLGRTNEDCTGEGRSLGGKPWSELRVIDTEFSRKKGGWSGLQTGVSGQHHED